MPTTLLPPNTLKLTETSDVIYFDYSITSTFRTCEEKARLSYEEHLHPKGTPIYFDFGGAWHEALAEIYIGKSNNLTDAELLDKGKRGFLKELRQRGGSLPIAMDQGEKRSIERAFYLLEAYIERWKNEPFENITYIGEGGERKPYVEIGFALFLFEWRKKPVMFVGRLDRIMRSRITGRPTIIESKTTTQPLTIFIKQTRPNHQITGYHWMAAELLNWNVHETIWDCVFVSSRQPDPALGRWGLFGIDKEKDFARTSTMRSPTDIEEFVFDLTMTCHRYLQLREANLRRWTRNAPTACHQFGGCVYRDICSSNLNPNIIKTDFKVERWEPWRGITVPKDEGK